MCSTEANCKKRFHLNLLKGVQKCIACSAGNSDVVFIAHR